MLFDRKPKFRREDLYDREGGFNCFLKVLKLVKD